MLAFTHFEALCGCRGRLLTFAVGLCCEPRLAFTHVNESQELHSWSPMIVCLHSFRDILCVPRQVYHTVLEGHCNIFIGTLKCCIFTHVGVSHSWHSHMIATFFSVTGRIVVNVAVLQEPLWACSFMHPSCKCCLGFACRSCNERNHTMSMFLSIWI